MAGTSQPIALPSTVDNSTDINMMSASYNLNGSLSASYYLGSPASWRAGSFGSRFYPGCSPGQLMGPLDPSDFKCAKISSSVESDHGSFINALGVLERNDEFCKNYSCCGLQIDDLHGLLQHFEEVHAVVTDAYGNPRTLVPPSQHPAPVRSQRPSHFPEQTQPTPQPSSSNQGSFDPDDMELDVDQRSAPSSGGSSPPDTPITTPLLSQPISSLNDFAASKLSDGQMPMSAFDTTVMSSGSLNGYNGHAGYSEYSSTVPSTPVSENPAYSNTGSEPGSPFGCLPPALVFSTTTTPANTPAVSRVPSPSNFMRAFAFTSSEGAGPSSKAPRSGSPAQASIRASTTLSRPASSLLLSKPFKCPKLNCNKSYKQANGLKYHMTHGSCNFAPPKDLEQVQALLASKRSQREAAGEDSTLITEGEMREVEREAERRLRPFACGIGDCQRRYKNMNGLRYHYQHSGDHGAIGLGLLASGQHECLQHTHSKNGSSRHVTPHVGVASTSLPVANAPATPSYAQQYQQQMMFQSAQQQQFMRSMQA